LAPENPGKLCFGSVELTTVSNVRSENFKKNVKNEFFLKDKNAFKTFETTMIDPKSTSCN